MTSTEIKTIELIVNSEQAKKRLDDLNQRLTVMKQKRDEALNKGDSKGLQIYTREVQKLEREIRNTESRAKTLGTALSNLDKATPNELKRTLRELQKELSSGKVARGSKEWDTLTKSIRETKTALAQVNDEMKAVKNVGFMDRVAEWNSKWMGLMLNLQAGLQIITGLRQGLQSLVADFAQMEEAMAQVRKYTGMTHEEVKGLNDELRKIDTRTSRERLNELAGDAGKLGITAKDKILEFVDAADKINVALGDDLGEDAVKNIGKLAMMFGEDDRMGLRAAMLATGSTINELSQNSSASAGYLESFAARLSGVGRQARLSQADIMGFGAVLDENMQTSELASTAFSQLITKMFQKPAKFAQLAGIEVQKFSALLKTDANEALLSFFEAMRARGGFDALAPMFAEMGLNGVRATGVLSAVADKLGDVREMQQLANQAYEEGTSVQNEFNVQNNTVQAGLDKAHKAVQEMRIELGEKLQPVAAKMLNFTTLFLRFLSTSITFISRHKGAILTLTATIVAYTIAVNAATIATKAKAAAMILVNGVTKAYTATVKALHAAHLILQLGMAKLQGNWARQSWLMLDVKKAGASLATGWGALIAGGVALAGTVITLTKNYIEKRKELERQKRAQQEYRNATAAILDVQKKAQESYNLEKKKLEQLLSIVRDNTKGLDERRAAIAQIQKVVPNYHASLNSEGKLTERNTNAIYDYLAALKKKAVAEALYAKLVESISKQADAEMAAAAWERGINYRLGEVEKARKSLQQANDYTESVTGGLTAGFTETAVVRRGTNEIYSSELRRQEDILRYDRERKAFHDQRVKDEEAYQNSLWAFAKKKGATAELEALVASGGTTTNIKDPGFGGAPGSAGTDGGPGSSGGGSGRGGHGTTTDPIKDAIEQLQREAIAKRLYNEMQYRAGLRDEQEYERQKFVIEEEYLAAAQKLYEEGSKEWNELQQKRFDNERAMLKQRDDWSLRDIARQENEEMRALQDKYLANQLTEEMYQEELLRIKLEYAKRRKDYTAQVGSEYEAKYAEQYEEEAYRQRIERQKKFLQQAQQMQKEYFKKSLDEQEQDEIALLTRLIEAGVIAKEKEEAYKAEIQKKYADLRAKQEKAAADEAAKKKKEEDEKKGKIEEPMKNGNSTLDEWSDSFITMMQNLNSLQQKLKDGEASWQDYAAVATAALGMISSVASSFTQLFTAEQQGEEQAIEKKYEKELEKAGSNSKKRKKIEEQKEKELAAVKNKYNSKAMAMELAQAVASTAMAAINAYASAAKIPLIGHIVAPIAAGMALAAGAVQIAAIKKQHAAQSSGYYSGGFTSGSNYKKEAGIVHEGEFVANHEAVNNPQILPVLRLIDHAQRTNTVARLTAEDVSRTLPGSATAVRYGSMPTVDATEKVAQIITDPAYPRQSAPQVQIIDSSSEKTAAALQRLNERLEQPIETYVTIDGPNGIDRQYTKYKKMMNRK